MVDSIVTENASEQCGLFSRRQVLGAGGNDNLISRRLESGRWLRVATGVYSLAGWPQSWRRSLWSAHLHVSPASVVSHEAAAALHGLILFRPGPVIVTVPHGDHERPINDVRVHQSTDLAPAHVTGSTASPSPPWLARCSTWRQSPDGSDSAGPSTRRM